MQYSEDFKKRVKEVYPNWDELHQAMERGEDVGKLLLKGCMSIKTYHKIFKDEGAEAAEKEVRTRHDLLNEYIDSKYQHEIEELDSELEEDSDWNKALEVHIYVHF